ncbi:hypothetical protein J6590_071273 [Homalodisca vitripennis]|nr:hypothetical protein J6590_071273 [Homalodisca vitripennis]
MIVHFPTGWSSASLAQQCSAASQQHSAPPLDRAHGTSRQCPSFLASKITRLDPMQLFLVGICEGKVFVPPLTHDIEELKNRITVAIRSVNADTLCKATVSARDEDEPRDRADDSADPTATTEAPRFPRIPLTAASVDESYSRGFGFKVVKNVGVFKTLFSRRGYVKSDREVHMHLQHHPLQTERLDLMFEEEGAQRLCCQPHND